MGDNAGTAPAHAATLFVRDSLLAMSIPSPSPEVLRRAKHNNPESVEKLLISLNALAKHIENEGRKSTISDGDEQRRVDKAGAESGMGLRKGKEQRSFNIVLSVLSKSGFPLLTPLCASNKNGIIHSRDLLLAFGWLVACVGALCTKGGSKNREKKDKQQGEQCGSVERSVNLPQSGLQRNTITSSNESRSIKSGERHRSRADIWIIDPSTIVSEGGLSLQEEIRLAMSEYRSLHLSVIELHNSQHLLLQLVHNFLGTYQGRRSAHDIPSTKSYSSVPSRAASMSDVLRMANRLCQHTVKDPVCYVKGPVVAGGDSGEGKQVEISNTEKLAKEKAGNIARLRSTWWTWLASAAEQQLHQSVQHRQSGPSRPPEQQQQTQGKHHRQQQDEHTRLPTELTEDSTKLANKLSECTQMELTRRVKALRAMLDRCQPLLPELRARAAQSNVAPGTKKDTPHGSAVAKVAQSCESARLQAADLRSRIVAGQLDNLEKFDACVTPDSKHTPIAPVRTVEIVLGVEYSKGVSVAGVLDAKETMSSLETLRDDSVKQRRVLKEEQMEVIGAISQYLGACHGVVWKRK